MDWLKEIKTNENNAISDLYTQFRGEAINWLYKQFKLDDDQGAEVFQEAVIILYDNVMTGKLVELTSSIKSYLFSICKNKARELKRKQSKIDTHKDINALNLIHEDEIGNKNKLEEYIRVMNRCLLKLGDPCKTLLQLYYYQKMKMDEISIMMEYSNANSAKNQKYKCVKRLQNLFLEHKGSNT